MTNREDESKMELKLVPVEPTPEMVDAWRIAFHESYNGGKGDADYNGHIRVGLKAALSTPSQGERVETPAPVTDLMPLIQRIAAVSIWQDHYHDGPDKMAGTLTLTPQDVRDCRSAVAATEGSAK